MKLRYDPELFQLTLHELTKAKVISEPRANLRSKMDSLLRSIENLEAKKSRIEYEIKKQKRSLARKRIELKKDSKSSMAKLESALESGVLIREISPGEPKASIDDYLLQESARILDD